jgi:hypothetical protein
MKIFVFCDGFGDGYAYLERELAVTAMMDWEDGFVCSFDTDELKAGEAKVTYETDADTMAAEGEAMAEKDVSADRDIKRRAATSKPATPPKLK